MQVKLSDMSVMELTETGTSLFGSAWVKPMAEVLCISEKSVKRWLRGTAISDVYGRLLRAFLEEPDRMKLAKGGEAMCRAELKTIAETRYGDHWIVPLATEVGVRHQTILLWRDEDQVAVHYAMLIRILPTMAIPCGLVIRSPGWQRKLAPRTA
jgi:hypothetical protein